MVNTATARSARVAIGLPVLNGAEHLVEAVESLLIQSYENFHLLVLDNCSTDATPAIVRCYAELDPRMIYERNPRQLGMTENWRRAFQLAVEKLPPFEYFCWASDHDLWHPDWLEALVRALDDNPGCVGAFPLTRAMAPDGTEGRTLLRLWDTAEVTEPAARVRAHARGIPVRAGSVVYGLFRAEAIARAGIYPSMLEPDRQLLARLAMLGSLTQVRRPLWSRRFGATKPSRARQRARLFTGHVPFHAYLPPAVVQSVFLFRWAGIEGAAKPEVGRVQGAQMAAEYLALASSARLQILSRRRVKTLRQWRKHQRRRLRSVRRITIRTRRGEARIARLGSRLVPGQARPWLRSLLRISAARER